VFSWPANNKNAGDGMIPPSESLSMAPTGNLAHAQNAVKRIQALKWACVPVPPTHRNTIYVMKNTPISFRLRAGGTLDSMGRAGAAGARTFCGGRMEDHLQDSWPSRPPFEQPPQSPEKPHNSTTHNSKFRAQTSKLCHSERSEESLFDLSIRKETRRDSSLRSE
jgi:hypothetical protein